MQVTIGVAIRDPFQLYLLLYSTFIFDRGYPESLYSQTYCPSYQKIILRVYRRRSRLRALWIYWHFEHRGLNFTGDHQVPLFEFDDEMYGEMCQETQEIQFRLRPLAERSILATRVIARTYFDLQNFSSGWSLDCGFKDPRIQ